jgi:hypothetical protein
MSVMEIMLVMQMLSVSIKTEIINAPVSLVSPAMAGIVLVSIHIDSARKYEPASAQVLVRNTLDAPSCLSAPGRVNCKCG